MKFIEKDRASSDDKIFNKDYNFTPKKGTETVSVNVSIPKDVLNTEPGDEEIFVYLALKPLEEPPRFLSATARTNMLTINA